MGFFSLQIEKKSAVSVSFYAYKFLVLNKLIKTQKFLVRLYSTFNIAHLSKFVVNFNLIMMSKPKYIVILMGLFCSVVAGGTSHFFLFFFPLLFWQGLIFWYDNIGLWLGKPNSGQKRIFLIARTSFGKVMPLFRFGSRRTLSKRYLENGPGRVASR